MRFEGWGLGRAAIENFGWVELIVAKPTPIFPIELILSLL